MAFRFMWYSGLPLLVRFCADMVVIALLLVTFCELNKLKILK